MARIVSSRACSLATGSGAGGRPMFGVPTVAVAGVGLGVGSEGVAGAGLAGGAVRTGTARGAGDATPSGDAEAAVAEGWTAPLEPVRVSVRTPAMSTATERRRPVITRVRDGRRPVRDMREAYTGAVVSPPGPMGQRPADLRPATREASEPLTSR